MNKSVVIGLAVLVVLGVVGYFVMSGGGDDTAPAPSVTRASQQPRSTPDVPAAEKVAKRQPPSGTSGRDRLDTTQEEDDSRFEKKEPEKMPTAKRRDPRPDRRRSTRGNNTDDSGSDEEETQKKPSFRPVVMP